MEEEKWKKELMDKFCVTFERAQDDSVVERLEGFIQSEINLAVSKERSGIVEMIEKEIDRIKNGDIKWVGLRKALKLIQNERTI